MKKTQNGFVLISVLLITSISTIYAFSALNDNRLQERIGGNQQKEMNARMLAEKGVFKAFEYIKLRNTPGASHAVITSEINDGLLNTLPGTMVYSASIGTNNTYTITSKGQVNGASAYFRAKIQMNSQRYITDYPGAIVGCEGVNIHGGVVDSYNGEDNIGPYDATTAGNNGDLATINDNSKIEIGNATVKGSINSNGSVDASSGTSNIAGDVSAQKDINLKDGNAGNIHAGGNTKIERFTLNGGLNTYGDLKHYGDLSISGEVTHGGSLQLGNEYNDYHDSIAHLGTSTIHEKNGKPVKVSGECDSKDIATAVKDIKSGATIKGVDMSTMVKHDGTALNTLTFSDSAETNAHIPGEAESYSGVVTESMDLSKLGFSEDQRMQDVYVFDSLKLINQNIEISGDVIFLVKGDIELGNGGTGFKFKDGDQDRSSLTIITDNKITIGAGAAVFPGSSKLNENNNAPFSVYSSYQSTIDRDAAYNPSNSDAEQNIDAAFLITGGANMYVNIHAPLGYVRAQASGEIYGAIRGKAVDIDGGVAIHYDEQLKKVKGDPIKDSETTLILSSYYHYPK
jgi:hypothetical protein